MSSNESFPHIDPAAEVQKLEAHGREFLSRAELRRYEANLTEGQKRFREWQEGRYHGPVCGCPECRDIDIVDAR